MALKHWLCKKCKQEIRSFEKSPQHCGESTDLILKTPNAKVLEPLNKEKGKSRLKDQMKILRKRSREHSRDHEIEDLITTSGQEQAIKNQWINKNGRKRSKIDDL